MPGDWLCDCQSQRSVNSKFILSREIALTLWPQGSAATVVFLFTSDKHFHGNTKKLFLCTKPPILQRNLLKKQQSTQVHFKRWVCLLSFHSRDKLLRISTFKTFPRFRVQTHFQKTGENLGPLSAQYQLISLSILGQTVSKTYALFSWFSEDDINQDANLNANPWWKVSAWASTFRWPVVAHKGKVEGGQIEGINFTVTLRVNQS